MVFYQMDFATYQSEANAFTVNPSVHSEDMLLFWALGLTGEVGEVANDIKKIFRDLGGQLSEQNKKKIIEELGDVLWYIAAIATTCGINLQDVAYGNLDKLYAKAVREVSKDVVDEASDE